MASNIKNRIYIIIIAITLYLSNFLSNYPTIGNDFDYWNIAPAINIEKSYFLNPDINTNYGFYILTTILSEISLITYDVIPTLPFQSIISFLLILLILNKIIHNDIIFSLFSLIIITNTGSVALWWPHGIGEILFYSLILITILRIQLNNIKIATSIILIILLLSINYISYKLTFISLIYLVNLYILEIVKIKNDFNKKAEIGVVTLIGIVYIFSFNYSIYGSIIPTAIYFAENYSSGLEKLLFYQFESISMLSDYYYQIPIEIRYINIIKTIILLTTLIISIYILIKTYIKKDFFSLSEKIILSYFISSILLFIIYNIIGYAEIGFLIFSGLLGYIILSNKSENYKKFVTLSLIFLIILNLFSHSVAIRTDFYYGQKADNNFQYINPGLEWYIKYGLDYPMISDIFTIGYFKKEFSKKELELKKGSKQFSNENIMFLFGLSNMNYNNINYYFINYKERSFYIAGWERLSSWTNHKQKIESNKFINLIYSSGNIVICNNYN